MKTLFLKMVFIEDQNQTLNILLLLTKEKNIKKEFESILIETRTSKAKIKLIRKEALYFGFEMCYKEKRYDDILTIANKLDKTILENSSELNDFVEAAEIMVEGLS